MEMQRVGDAEIVLDYPIVNVDEISMEWFIQTQSSDTPLERFLAEQDFGVTGRLLAGGRSDKWDVSRTRN